MAFSQGQEDDVFAAINITPLTDVLLVLLIIFMIAAATIQKEKIKIPTTRYKDKANEADTIISVDKDNKIYVGANEVAYADLEPYLEKIRKGMPPDDNGQQPNKVIIKADEDALYGTIAEVMDASKSAGLNEISLATKPLEKAPAGSGASGSTGTQNGDQDNGSQ